MNTEATSLWAPVLAFISSLHIVVFILLYLLVRLKKIIILRVHLHPPNKLVEALIFWSHMVFLYPCKVLLVILVYITEMHALVLAKVELLVTFVTGGTNVGLASVVSLATYLA